MEKAKEFMDLIVWQKGHALVLFVYTITKKLPSEEKFGLSSQIQRASVSITSNIAEGFGRKGEKEKIQFYYMAHGSLTEVMNLSFVLRDTKLITEEEYQQLDDLLINTNRLLLGLIKSIINSKEI